MSGLNISQAAGRKAAVPGGNIDMIYSPAAPARHGPVICDNGPGADPAVRRLFKAHPALGMLSEQERVTLLRRSRIRFHKRHDIICRQGDPASYIVLILEGFVKLSVPLSDGGEVFLEIARPGESFNEMLALQARPHASNATALSACQVLLIDTRQFREAFEPRPDRLLAVLRLVDERLQRTTEQLMDSRGLTAPVRLAKALLYLAALPPPHPGIGARLPFRLSQGELSFMAGMSREIVNKQLRAWRDAGWIEMSSGTVAWVDVKAFSAMVGGKSACLADSRCRHGTDRCVPGQRVAAA